MTTRSGRTAIVSFTAVSSRWASKYGEPQWMSES